MKKTNFIFFLSCKLLFRSFFEQFEKKNSGNGIVGTDAELLEFCAVRENYLYQIPNGAITIDGLADECFWQHAPTDHFSMISRVPSTTHVKVQMLYDDVNLYVFYDGFDVTPVSFIC